MTVQVKSHAFFGKKLLTQETKMISGVTIRESCNDISTRRWVKHEVKSPPEKNVWHEKRELGISQNLSKYYTQCM